jgi:hypothetical protein
VSVRNGRFGRKLRTSAEKRKRGSEPNGSDSTEKQKREQHANRETKQNADVWIKREPIVSGKNERLGIG